MLEINTLCLFIGDSVRCGPEDGNNDVSYENELVVLMYYIFPFLLKTKQ